MPTPIPWIIALGTTALVALAKSSKAKQGTAAPPIVPQPITNQPVGGGVPIQPKPVPKTTLPPILPPDAVEVPAEDVEIITSPGQPTGRIKNPKTVLEPILEDINEAVDKFPIPPEIIEQPITIDEPVSQVPIDLGDIDLGNIDLGKLEPIEVEIPGEGLELLDPTDLAVEVYNITVDGIRNLKGSEVRTIKAYQTEQGVKVDGFYGPKTAETLIKFGFVPATPWIWPKTGTAKAKSDWRELTADMAERDPQRADEWAESGRV